MTIKGCGTAVAIAIVVLTSACGGSPAAPTGPSQTTPPQTAPTATTSVASVRWVGNSPDGMRVEQDPLDQCPAEFDLELNLTVSGTVVTGNATTRLRRVEARGPCDDVLGSVHTYSLSNGRLESDRISFDLGGSETEPHRFTGSMAATRITGTFSLAHFQQRGSFLVHRQ